MIYLIAFCMCFATVFLKGWQHNNVIKQLYVNTFVTSYLMNFLDVLLIGLIVKAATWEIAVFTGAGASFGMVSSMYLHNIIYGKKVG